MVLALCFVWVKPLHGQDKLSLPRLVKEVLTDPTTYTPATLYWIGTEGDWVSSQVWFRHGYLERNRLYTIDGQSPGIPVSFGTGNRTIARFTAQIFAMSAATNSGVRAGEYLLINRYPERKRLIRSIGIASRIVVGVLTVKGSTMPHISQWQKNNRLPDSWPK